MLSVYNMEGIVDINTHINIFFKKNFFSHLEVQINVIEESSTNMFYQVSSRYQSLSYSLWHSEKEAEIISKKKVFATYCLCDIHILNPSSWA